MVKQTKLHSEHVSSGGLMVDFAGWHMPLHYGSQIKEHEAVRNNCGMFDVSHMTVVDITGDDAKTFARFVLANNIDKLKSNDKAFYGCMLDSNGGIIDDLITYYLSDEHIRIVVNAATTEKDLNWFNKQAASFSVEVEKREDLNIVAVQGPDAIAVLLKVYPALDDTISNLAPFSCSFVKDSRFNDWFIARTGYTGEDGVEVILPDRDVVEFWQSLNKNDVPPIGLGARDTLRLEAGLNLYGQDMDENFNPYNSNLGWTVAMKPEDRNFIGRDALTKIDKNSIDKMIGLVLEDKGVIRPGQKVFVNDEEVGVVTSGGYSPTTKKSIALARVVQPVQESYLVQIRNKKLNSKVVKPPFVKHGKVNF